MFEPKLVGCDEFETREIRTKIREMKIKRRRENSRHYIQLRSAIIDCVSIFGRLSTELETRKGQFNEI